MRSRAASVFLALGCLRKAAGFRAGLIQLTFELFITLVKRYGDCILLVLGFELGEFAFDLLSLSAESVSAALCETS